MSSSVSHDFHAIPDGEYDLEISDTLQALLFAKSPSLNGTRGKNNEVLSISYSDPQNEHGIDLSKPFTISRETGEDGFTMNTDSTKFKRGATFKGNVRANKALKSVLVFNPATGVFELQQIDNELSTTQIKETEEEKHEEQQPTPTPPPSSSSSAQVRSPLNNPANVKKRVHKEPSIFQPKVRTPVPTLPRPKKLTRDNSNVSDSSPPSHYPEKPVTPLNPASERGVPPSPLTQHMTTSNDKTSETGSPKASTRTPQSPGFSSSTSNTLKPAAKTTAKTTAPSSSAAKAPSTKPKTAGKTTPKTYAGSTSDKRPRQVQYGSKKPPSTSTSTVSTPVNAVAASPTPDPSSNSTATAKAFNESEGEEVSDGELDDLVGELEDELEFDNFGEENNDNDNGNGIGNDSEDVIDFDNFSKAQSDFITVEEDIPMSMDFHFGEDDDMIVKDDNGSTTATAGTAKKRPMSFRDLVGDDGRDDEEALSSSSEEE